MRKIFQVRIPPWAREAFGRKARLTRRFVNEDAGKAWEQDIQAKLAKLRAGAEVASLGIQEAKDIDFRAAAGCWLAENDVRANTKKWYRELLNGHILPELRNVRVSEIGRVRIVEYFGARKLKDGTPDSLKRDLIVIRAVLRWARERGYRVDATAWQVKAPKTTPKFTRSFDPEKIQHVLDSITSPRDKAILEVAALTGMRGNELRYFRVEWIRWLEESITIPHDEMFSPKGRASRNIPMGPRLIEVLKTWLGQRTEGLVFEPLRTGRSGNGRTAGAYLRGVIRRARKASGVNIRDFKDFRHH